jgi:glycosyltransferase involved in cell wall biosynthesis
MPTRSPGGGRRADVRIAIDARELLGRSTGVGRYLGGILDVWASPSALGDDEVVLCAPAVLPPDTARFPTLIDGALAGRSGGTTWEQLTLPRLVARTRADVLFAPAYSAPLFCPVPVVLAMHDVSFAVRPDWYSRREGARRRTMARLSARRAARVLTISDHSRQEIVRWLGVVPARITVAYPGVTSMASTVSTGREDLVLFVGSLFSRRHVRELIAAFAELARRRAGLRLEIVGDNRTTPRDDFEGLAAATGVADRIALRAYVPDSTLAELYRRARAFVFLSEYEGFGLTPVEALGAGVPIVVLDTPVAREIYGEAAAYVSTPDPPVVRDALERVLFDERERQRILDAAQRLLPRYSWRSCAEAVLTALRNSARRGDSTT